MGPPTHVHLMLPAIEGNGKAEVRLFAAIQRAVHERLVQIKHLEGQTPVMVNLWERAPLLGGQVSCVPHVPAAGRAWSSGQAAGMAAGENVSFR